MGPTEPINADARARFAVLQELGCVVSRVFFHRPDTPGEIHHLLSGGRRRGHNATICLHPWFHRGVPPLIRHAGGLKQLTVSEATDMYGPSLALAPRSFARRFATEEVLLAMQDRLIGVWSSLRAGTRGAA